MNIIVSHAQNREDIILRAFLADIKKGFYVDIGAADPNKDSVTKFFYDLGWHGINIEPNEDLYIKLQKHRPKDVNINTAIDEKKGVKKLRIYAGTNYGLSTLSEKTKKQYEKNEQEGTTRFKDVSVPVDSLRSILKAQKVQNIDFMKIDVEGAEDIVIKSNDWQTTRPKVLCIEANHIQGNWKEFLIKQNYNLVFSDGLNEYYLAHEELQRRDTFTDEYLKLAVGSHIVRPELQHIIGMDATKEERLKRKNSEQASLIARQESYIQQIEKDLRTNPGMVNSMKLFVNAVILFLEKQGKRIKNKVYKKDYPHNAVEYVETGKGLQADIMYYDYGTFDLKPGIHYLWFMVNLVFGALKYVVVSTLTFVVKTLKWIKGALK